MYVLKSGFKMPELMVISAIWVGRRVGRLSWTYSRLSGQEAISESMTWTELTEDALGKKISKHKGLQDAYEQGTNEKPNASHWCNESTVKRQERSYRSSRRGPQSHLWMRGLTLRGWGPTEGLNPTCLLLMWPWTKLEAQRWVPLLQDCFLHKLNLLMPILKTYVDNLVPSSVQHL